MLAKLKADYEAAKAYLVTHYKQLLAAGLAGKFSSALVSAGGAIVALVHKVL